MRIRARDHDSKLERREAIIDAACALYRERGLAHFAMADVAARAGLAKGTLYLYFETREELLLSVLETEFGAWVDVVAGELASLTAPTPARVADKFATTIASRPHFVALLSASPIVFESNVSYETAVAYKRKVLSWTVRLAAELERCLPHCRPADGVRLLLCVNAIAVGFGQMAGPVPLMRRVLEDLSLEVFVPSLEVELRRYLTILFSHVDEIDSWELANLAAGHMKAEGAADPAAEGADAGAAVRLAGEKADAGVAVRLAGEKADAAAVVRLGAEAEKAGAKTARRRRTGS